MSFPYVGSSISSTGTFVVDLIILVIKFNFFGTNTVSNPYNESIRSTFLVMRALPKRYKEQFDGIELSTSLSL
jgi:hypothetical protein